MIQCKYCSVKTRFRDRMPSLVSLLSPWVDALKERFSPHQRHSASSPFFLSGEFCTPSSLIFQPRQYGLYCLGCEPSALNAPSFFSLPIEGCYFDEVVRHLYEQKREFECIPFYPSYTGLLAQATSTRL